MVHCTQRKCTGTVLLGQYSKWGKKEETEAVSSSEMMQNYDNDKEVEGETVCVCMLDRQTSKESNMKQKLSGKNLPWQNTILNTISKPKTFHDSS
jgi:hypothetical protein